MRGESDPGADPYRTLGLEPGASMAEVKRAYRLLAKTFHPDSAGEAALPRFLAIHGAYEELKTGRVVPRARPQGTPTAEPWQADPARARAARERARTARSGPASKGRPTSAAGPAGPGGSARDAGASESAGPSAGSSGRASTGTRGSARRRDARKATMGSTSYDESRDHGDATWSGAAWYGPSSGEYWIVNPREYADPRKHGPEYLSRARRPLPGDRAAAAEAAPDASTGGEAAAGESMRRDAPSHEAAPAPRVGSDDAPPAGHPGRGQAPATGGSPVVAPANDPVRRLATALRRRLVPGGRR